MPLKCVPCVIMRGGTSKGIFFKKDDLPVKSSRRNEIILKIFGSGDPMQIDGLGGSHTHTSKTMIVWKSEKPSIDVEYLFGQVGIEKKFIDYTGNCGNLTAAVAPFAIDEGLVEANEPYTLVRMYNVNTNKRIDALVPVENNTTKYEGDFLIDGVPNPGARIDLTWHEPEGAVSGSILPTGNPTDKIQIDGKMFEVSIIDAANPAVFVRAGDVGMKGTELPDEVGEEVIEKLEKIRSKAAEIMGLVENAEDAKIKTLHFPFIVVVGEKQDYITSTGKIVKSSNYTILARLFSLQKMHHAYAVTGAICTAVAAKIPGTIVNALNTDYEKDDVIIGHPKGTMDVKVEAEIRSNKIRVERVTLGRTARRLMKGWAYYIEST